MRSPTGATLLSSALSHCSITHHCFSSSASSTGNVKTSPLINEDNNAYFKCLYSIMKAEVLTHSNIRTVKNSLIHPLYISIQCAGKAVAEGLVLLPLQDVSLYVPTVLLRYELTFPLHRLLWLDSPAFTCLGHTVPSYQIRSLWYSIIYITQV